MFLRSVDVSAFPANVSMNGIENMARTTFTPWKIDLPPLSGKDKEKLLQNKH